MTGALTVCAFTFMRYSLAVTPKNYLLFACYFLNAAGAQMTQGHRWTQYYYGRGQQGEGGGRSGYYYLVVSQLKAGAIGGMNAWVRDTICCNENHGTGLDGTVFISMINVRDPHWKCFLYSKPLKLGV